MFEEVFKLIIENSKGVAGIYEALGMAADCFEEMTKHIIANRDRVNELTDIVKEDRDEIVRMQKVIGGLIIRINALEGESDYINQVGG